MIRFDKASMLDEVKEFIKDGEGIFILGVKGLRTSEMESFRKNIRTKGKMIMCKNSVLKIALKQTNLEHLSSFIQGPAAVAVSTEDPSVFAKEIVRFSSRYPSCVIQGGALNSNVLDSAAVKHLASLPSRQELLVQVARAAQSPIVGFAWTLSGMLKKLVYTLEQVKNKK
jgi:large subunit ribosomal protein L10